jgi:hypothetical protein
LSAYENFGQQVRSDYGHSIPVNTSYTNNIPFKVMLVFAEFASPCTLYSTPAWPAGGIPADAADWIDPVLPASGPHGFLTKYFFDASMDQYRVLGDYPSQVVTIPCGAVNNAFDGNIWVINELAKLWHICYKCFV